jgi:sugar phosphate isomerase/epimerase
MIKNTSPAIWTGMYVEQPLHEAIVTLAEHGWRSFEVSTEHFEMIEASGDVDRLIELTNTTCTENGLTIKQGHASLGANVAHPDPSRRDSDMATLRTHIDMAQSFGIECLVIHPGCRPYPTTRDEFKTMIDLNVQAFRELGDLAGERNMKIGLENLPRTSAFDTSAKMLDLIDAIGNSAIGINFDTSHSNIAPGIDAGAAIRDFGTLMIGTHLSDNDGSGDQHKTPGGGKIDWIEIMTALSDIDYAGVINLEIPGERHPVDALKELKSRHACQVAQWLVTDAVQPEDTK